LHRIENFLILHERIILKLPDTIEECHVLIRQLYEVINGLTQRVVDLENRLNQNSGNSHRPPSSDGLRKPAFPKKASKGKIGGKENHRGDTLKKMDNPDKIVALQSEVCEHCSRRLLKSDGFSCTIRVKSWIYRLFKWNVRSIAGWAVPVPDAVITRCPIIPLE
jgi:hypothetical protein